MIDALVAGRLYGAPAERTSSKTGARFATAKLRVPTTNGESIFATVIAFDADAVAALMPLGDGDSVALAGQIKPTAWVAPDGQARAGIDVTAQRVLTVGDAKRKRQARAQANEPTAQAATSQASDSAPFNDAIDF